ncbi:mycothiol-dependent nitroreductase Rv2466c family protein [Plantactinospora endophytica]|uniref:DsbA family protein n=1 Tax=Plantactinospora endophytica TaxID=673535 RepID=A0ABQ4EB82_9ACTN|nr:hypothetical protein [Plantactinospora endophytica]GIG91983.1 hypothetical protein Pen02_69190 [Plantactinospora endophytica]
MEKITFLFDPRSPWCYQTSRWARRLEALGEIELDWGLFSLEVVNLAADEDPAALDAEYGAALRTAILLRDRHGRAEMGRFYAALGALMWEQEPPAAGPDGPAPAPSSAESSRAALAALGHDPALVDAATADPATWTAVLAEHRSWLDRVRGFGVPTLVFDGGAGPAVFGPVIRELPDDETCVELWRHFSGLARYDYLFEVKRRKELTLRAELPAAVWRADLRVQAMRAAREAQRPGGPYEGSSLEWAMAGLRQDSTS